VAIYTRKGEKGEVGKPQGNDVKEAR